MRDGLTESEKMRDEETLVGEREVHKEKPEQQATLHGIVSNQ